MLYFNTKLKLFHTVFFPQQNFLNIYQESDCYEKDILVIDKGKRSLYFGTFCILVVRCSELLNSCLLHLVTVGEKIGSICLVSGLFWWHATADLVFFSWRIVVPNCLNAYCIRDERMYCVQRACGSQHNKWNIWWQAFGLHTPVKYMSWVSSVSFFITNLINKIWFMIYFSICSP